MNVSGLDLNHYVIVFISFSNLSRRADHTYPLSHRFQDLPLWRAFPDFFAFNERKSRIRVDRTRNRKNIFTLQVLQATWFYSRCIYYISLYFCWRKARNIQTLKIITLNILNEEVSVSWQKYVELWICWLNGLKSTWYPREHVFKTVLNKQQNFSVYMIWLLQTHKSSWTIRF